MKATTLIAVAMTTPIIAAATESHVTLQARNVYDMAMETAPSMAFTGPLHLGGPNVTLTGTAESIYHQIIEMNPSYDAWQFPEYQSKMAALGLTQEILGAVPQKRHGQLEKRGGTTCDPNGEQVDNWITQCGEGIGYLGRLNGYCGAPGGWGGCSRVSCSHSCGIFLCNDNPFPIDVWCGNLVGDFYDIAAECGEEWYEGLVISLKGQIFRDGPPAWNTIVKRQSC